MLLRMEQYVKLMNCLLLEFSILYFQILFVHGVTESTESTTENEGELL